MQKMFLSQMSTVGKMPRKGGRPVPFGRSVLWRMCCVCALWLGLCVGRGHGRVLCGWSRCGMVSGECERCVEGAVQ